MDIQKINRHIVKPIPIPNENKNPALGEEICSEAYANIFLVAKKKSGKTSALYHILKTCTGPNTKIVIFCSTLYKDKNWIQIVKWIKKKNIPFSGYTGIFEEDEDKIDQLLKDLSDDAKEGGLEEDDPDMPYISPEYIIIFDDISDQLKSPSLLKLLKWNRHYKSKVIISSQWLNDMLPESRKQIDLWLVFKGMPLEKLKEIHRDADVSLSLEDFTKIYVVATREPYSFLYIDTRNEHFRKNFNTKIILRNSN